MVTSSSVTRTGSKQFYYADHKRLCCSKYETKRPKSYFKHYSLIRRIRRINNN